VLIQWLSEEDEDSKAAPGGDFVTGMTRSSGTVGAGFSTKGSMTQPRRHVPAAAPTAPETPATAAARKRQALRNDLLATVDLLQRRQAERIDPSLMADYVALDWFEWSGGALRITLTGQNICKQIRNGLL